MSYKALYRTYRPQTFEEVAGQKHIIQTLKNALATNKIAHAYLFCGPRGTGKTTMAKLFAKALNCSEGIGHQCNQCANCREIMDGSHPDVIEIDAASNNGVEQVRDLIDKVNYSPLEGRYKVYIIDEVHMMTTNAFNALLKTLEEPPAHVVFILATTEPHNILPTIISRCQRYDFTKVSDGDIYQRMVEILDKEHITYTKEAVNAIISLADGGVRDALSILDQILAYSGSSLNEEDVYTLFGLASTEEKISFLQAINKGDISTCLNKINNYAQGGIDIKRLTSDLLEILKDVLVIKKTNDENQLTVIREEDANKLANEIDIKTLNEMIGTFLKALSDYKTVNNVKTMFEVIVLRLCTLKDVAEEPKVITKVVEKTVEVTKPQKPIDKVVEVKPVQPAATIKKEESKPAVKSEPPSWLFDDDKNKKVVEDEGDKVQLDDDTIIQIMVLADKQARKNLMSRWGELDMYLGHPTLGDIIALIKDGKPYIVSKEAVVLEYDLVKMSDKVNIKANQAEASKLLSKMLGRDIFVYALSRGEAVRLYKAYTNLIQVSKLPKASEIKLNLKENL